MLERLYKYRVKCDGGCNNEMRYETTHKKSLPNGWVEDRLSCSYAVDEVYHYCPSCWQDLVKQRESISGRR